MKCINLFSGETYSINERFDKVLCAPLPYSDINYPNYKSKEEWYRKYLMYNIKKSINILVIGGKLLSNEKYNINNLEYEGIKNNSHSWVKLYDENPNFIIQKYENIDIVRDDLLESGSKQRAVISIIRKLSKNYDEFIVPTSEYGIGGLTLAYACSLFNKIAHIFVTDKTKMYPEIRNKIEKCGGIIHSGFSSMRDIYSRVTTFKEGKNIYEFQLGFEGELFYKTLEKKLKFTLGTTFNDKWLSKYDEIWVVGGTGSLSKILFNIFINSKIIAVQVGKNIKNTITDPRYKIVIYNKPFSYKSKIIPPFNSMPNYDTKAWEMLIKSNRYGKNILFWNVFGIKKTN